MGPQTNWSAPCVKEANKEFSGRMRHGLSSNVQTRAELRVLVETVGSNVEGGAFGGRGTEPNPQHGCPPPVGREVVGFMEGARVVQVG